MKADELMNSWLSNGKLALEPAREFGEIAKRAYDKTGEQNVSAMKEYVDFSLRGMKLLSGIRDPRALMDQQLALVKEASEIMLANTQVYATLANETQAEMAAWVEKATSVAVDEAEEVVEQAA